MKYNKIIIVLLLTITLFFGLKLYSSNLGYNNIFSFIKDAALQNEITDIADVNSLEVGINFSNNSETVGNLSQNSTEYNDNYYDYTKEKNQQIVKVLVIEINPTLYSITDTKYAYNNNHPKVSDLLQKIGEEKTAIQEVITDFEDASNNYFKIETTWEYLDEYPTYTCTFHLNDGTVAHRFDEKTYLEMVDYDGISANWYSMLDSEYYNEILAYSFDYNYIINKYNLIEKRNNNEFDQVWLITIDPASTFETTMVGKNSYWINGTPITADCNNFILANISISRRDANLHAFGHGVEGIMSHVFRRGYDTSMHYNKSYYTKNIPSNYDDMNLWEKFQLGAYNSTGNIMGIGNIHFPFNGNNDYDYDNTTFVDSTWKDWLNYPNLTGAVTKSNCSAWKDYELNQKIVNDQNQNSASDRLYSRFWLSLLPNVSGYTDDGYYNNWWKYIYSLDYITNIVPSESTQKEIKSGSKIFFDITLFYSSGKTQKVEKLFQSNNIHIENKEIVNFDNSGNLIAKKAGNTTITIYFDGLSTTYDIIVK